MTETTDPLDTHGMTMDGEPAMPILVAEYNALVSRVNEAEARAAVPSAPADRAAILREAADAIEEAQHRRDDIVNDALGFLDNNTEQQHLAVHRSGRLLRRMAVEAQQPASTAPLAADLPLVKGRCPACNGASLFLGDGGYVTCSRIDCPEPDAASTALEQPVDEAQRPEAERCGAWGGCTLARGHNIGQADIPENHRAPQPAVGARQADTAGEQQ